MFGSLVSRYLKQSRFTEECDKDPAEDLVPRPYYYAVSLPEAFFNLDEVLAPLFSRKPAGHVFDVTVFYSRRKDGISGIFEEALSWRNQQAFDAASKTGHLLIYYQGPVIALRKTRSSLRLDFHPDCMSFCVWDSLAHAREALKTREHAAAVQWVDHWYASYGIRKFSATLEENGSGIHFDPYERPRKIA